MAEDGHGTAQDIAYDGPKRLQQPASGIRELDCEWNGIRSGLEERRAELHPVAMDKVNLSPPLLLDGPKTRELSERPPAATMST